MSGRKRIAVLVDYMESEYVQKIISGVRSYSKSSNLDVVVFCIAELCSQSVYDTDYQYLSVASLINPANIDGGIILGGPQLSYASKDYLHSFIKSFSSIPFVSIGVYFQDIPSIIPSGKLGMKEIVDHVIEKHGCRNLVLMGVQFNSEEAMERTEIFKESLKEHGIEFNPEYHLYGDYTYDNAQRAITQFYDKFKNPKVDAIVCLNDDMAYACIDFLHEKNFLIPEDIIVTGYDDLIRSAYITPALSTVNQSIETQGYEACRMIQEILEKGEEHLEFKVKFVDSKAIFRQSCGCVAFGERGYNGLDSHGNKIQYSIQDSQQVVAEWCTKRLQFMQVIYLYSNMRNKMSLDDFRYSCNTEMSLVDICAGAIVLFENPISTDYYEYFNLPERAYVFSAFDQRSGYSLTLGDDYIHFNPREKMIPEGIFSSMDNLMVSSLYAGTILYGYLIINPGKFDSTAYSMVHKMIASSISTSYIFTQKEAERRELEKEYSVANEISITDELTGLMNRRGIISLGQQSLDLGRAIGQSGLLLFGDLDGLKMINDTYGHSAGDEAIKAEAQILRKIFRSVDIIGRLGGDEFIVIAPGMSVRKFVSVRQRMEDACRQYNEKSGQQFTLSISIGYAEFTPTNKNYDIHMLMELADNALYLEKKAKKMNLK